MIIIQPEILQAIRLHGEQAYPEEGAGLLLGTDGSQARTVLDILPFPNAREDDARRNRYLITAKDMLHGEQEAARRDLDVLGVFHSHPDHPAQPSEFDREWALPWFSYFITSVQHGQAQVTRSWRLADDRTAFQEEQLGVLEDN